MSFPPPPPSGAPNVNAANPLRPYYGSPLDASPLQSYYQNTLSTSALEEELVAQQEISSQEAARELLSYGAVKFLTLALAAPFEAGQTLLQVQYLPNDDGANERDEDMYNSAAEQVGFNGESDVNVRMPVHPCRRTVSAIS